MPGIPKYCYRSLRMSRWTSEGNLWTPLGVPWLSWEIVVWSPKEFHSWMGGTLEHPPPDKNDDPHRQITMTSPNDGPRDQNNFLYSLDLSSRFLPILSSLCPSLFFKEVRWKHLRNPWLSPKASRGEHSWSTHEPLMNHSWTRASLLWSGVC